jgi:flagellar basal body-associated protein FliL
MLNEEVTKVEIKKIVNDEVRKTIGDELNKQLKISLKNGAGRDEIKNHIKDALNALFKFMYVKKSNWNSEIK